MSNSWEGFWEWMRSKGYGFSDGVRYLVYADKTNAVNGPTQQMLIGYMLQYLTEEKGEFVGMSTSTTERRSLGFSWESMGDYFQRLLATMGEKTKLVS